MSHKVDEQNSLNADFNTKFSFNADFGLGNFFLDDFGPHGFSIYCLISNEIKSNSLVYL